MALSQTFSRVYEAWHRRGEDDLKHWLDVWMEAFHLADFILDDADLAQAVAHDAVSRIDEEHPKRRHQLNNLAWYQNKSGKSGRHAGLRKPLLRDHQYLDLLVYYFSRRREDEKLRRGNASLNDIDVWFMKSVFEHSYWLHGRQQGAPTLRLLLGVSGAILTYQVYEQVPLIWTELVKAVPRRKELWSPGQEPFQVYWQKLLKSIRERFGSLVQRDGPDDFARRGWNEQSEDLAWQCMNRFELRESRELCLSKVKRLGNDNLVETMRLHVITHRMCFTTLVNRARLPRPEKKIRLPEYKVKIEDSHGNRQRGDSQLSEQQLDEVRRKLRETLYRRKNVSPSAIVVTLDNEEQHRASKELNERGRTMVKLPETARLCQIWARSKNGRGDVLLTACPLSHLVSKPRVVLDSGDVISLAVQFVADGGDGSEYQMKVVYRKGRIARCLQAILPDGAFVTPLIEYPRLSAGLISLMLLLIGLSARPVGAPLIARLFSHPEQQLAPVQRDNSSVDLVAVTPSPNPAPTLPPRLPIPGRNGRQGGLTNAQSVTVLAQVDRIYVEKPELFAAGVDNRLVRSAQEDALDEGRAVHTTQERSAAQATLILNTDYRSGGKQFVRPKLTLKSGVVLWEGPLIEVGQDKNSNTGIGSVRETQIKLLIEQLKSAVKELLKARAEDQKRR